MALDTTILAERWGDLFGGINEANTFAGTTLATRTDNIFDEYTSLAAQRDAVDDLYDNAVDARTAMGTWSDYLHEVVELTLQAMCRDDSARPKTDDLAGWWDKLVRDMKAQNDSFAQPTTLTGTVAVAASNIGDGYLLTSMVEPSDYNTLANADVCSKGLYFSYSEVIRFECDADSFDGGATAGSETFAYAGETSVDKKAYNWPKGSGASGSLTAANPTSSTAILTDGGLEDWGTPVTDTLTSWTPHTAALVTRGGTSPYNGSYFAILTGDGAQTLGLYQAITENVAPNTNYAVNFWIKVPTTTWDTTGTQTELRVGLVDGSGTLIADNAGVNQASNAVGTAASGGYIVATAAAGASTQLNATYLNSLAGGSWTRVSLILRTPRYLPAVTRLEFKFITQTPLTTEIVYLDDITMVEMTQLYDGGPYAAIVAGATEFAAGDTFTLTVVNATTALSATQTFVRNLDRTFDLAANGLRVVADGAASASDADALIA